MTEDYVAERQKTWSPLSAKPAAMAILDLVREHSGISKGDRKTLHFVELPSLAHLSDTIFSNLKNHCYVRDKSILYYFSM